MADLGELQKKIQEAIDNGATSIEQVHKSIAKIPYDVLEKIYPVDETSEEVRKAHDQTIGSVYNTIRNLNEHVGTVAAKLLEKVTKK